MAKTSNRFNTAEFDKATKAAREYLKKYPVETTEPSVPRTYVSSRTHPLVKGLAAAGGITLAAAASYGAFSFMQSEAAESVSRSLCEINESVGDEPCGIEAVSDIRVSSKFNTSTLVDNVVVHELVNTGEVREGIGANSGLVALVVEVDTRPGQNYDSTELSNLLGDDLDATTFFGSFYRYAQEYDVPVAAVAQGCAKEFEGLMTAIRSDPKSFATDAIPSKELLDPTVVFHRTDFAPFTDLAIPIERQEVVFVHNGNILTCPEP